MNQKNKTKEIKTNCKYTNKEKAKEGNIPTKKEKTKEKC